VFFLWAASITAGAAAASVFPVYWLFFRGNKEAYSPVAEAEPAQGFDANQLAENIAGRDFVYLILFLAVIGRAHWFAYICLVGVFAFLAFVVFLAVRRLLARS
jgi:hypothetical protein